MNPKTTRLAFPGSGGGELAAALDMPVGAPRAYALFAHCFTCSKDLHASRRLSAGLAALGIAVLRFDFTGLGNSEGDFASTNFSSNVEDLVRAADYLRTNYAAPSILIGHSLGGAAVLAAAGEIPDARAVVTIGAPADVGHVLHNFGTSLDRIREDGEAEVTLAGRRFNIRRHFIENAEEHRLSDRIARLGKALLVMHAPLDHTVGIDNATRIFTAARHPKSFITLDDADHLLSRPEDGNYAAGVIAAWATRYLPAVEEPPVDKGLSDHQDVLVRETGEGRFQNAVTIGRHNLLADEPVAVGGMDSGPSPYDYLSIALGACTAMTLRIYAGHKKLELGRIGVTVSHGKVAADHCDDCGKAADGRAGRIDRFERVIEIEGGADPSLHAKLLEIADKCPVHRTLEATSAIVTRIGEV
ncbi:MAG: hypothetical protein RLZ98_3347 [Pseudomonadota bacterium]|jgi:putative redox protein